MAQEGKINSLRDLNKCIHYCPMGGHLWVHDKLKKCPWTIKDTTRKNETIRLIVVCEEHSRGSCDELY